MDDIGKLTVRDMLEEYEDIQDELETIIETFASWTEEMQIALMDLEDEADEIRAHLVKCENLLCRFRKKNPA